MKTQINQTEMRREWVLTSWFDKTVHVIGWIFTIYLIAAFCVGFVLGLIN